MKNFKRAGHEQRSRAFTLVEMLVVMAIISILLVVTVPALKGINGTGSRKSAVSTLMGVLDQARMLAISDGRATYVVFAGTQLANTACSSMVGQAYAIFEESPDFVPYQRSAWQYLPIGVSFKVASDYDTLVNRSLSDQDPKFNVAVPKATSAQPLSVQLPSVMFDATGAVAGTLANANEPQQLRLLLFDGLVSGGGVEQPTRHVSASTSQNALLDEVRINPSTGRAKYTLDQNDNLPSTST